MSLYFETITGSYTTRTARGRPLLQKPVCSAFQCTLIAVGCCDSGNIVSDRAVRCNAPLCGEHLNKLGPDLHTCALHLTAPKF